MSALVCRQRTPVPDGPGSPRRHKDSGPKRAERGIMVDDLPGHPMGAEAHLLPTGGMHQAALVIPARGLRQVAGRVKLPAAEPGRGRGGAQGMICPLNRDAWRC